MKDEKLARLAWALINPDLTPRSLGVVSQGWVRSAHIAERCLDAMVKRGYDYTIYSAPGIGVGTNLHPPGGAIGISAEDPNRNRAIILACVRADRAERKAKPIFVPSPEEVAAFGEKFESLARMTPVTDAGVASAERLLSIEVHFGKPYTTAPPWPPPPYPKWTYAWADEPPPPVSEAAS